MASQSSQETVSSPEEELILVDHNDRETGFQTKFQCHQGDGVLHRAFSIFLFNDVRQMLIQQRSVQKLLWGLCWSNSVCSHPRKGEAMEEAVQRRLKEEMGVAVPLTYLYKFEYQARYKNIGIEHELCWVYIGKVMDKIKVHPDEIADCKFINIDELEEAMRQRPDLYTPWFHLEWAYIKKHHWTDIQHLWKA